MSETLTFPQKKVIDLNMSDKTERSPTSTLETKLSELQISDEDGCDGGCVEETVYFKGKGVPQKRPRQFNNPTGSPQPAPQHYIQSSMASSYNAMPIQPHFDGTVQHQVTPGYILDLLNDPAKTGASSGTSPQLPGSTVEAYITVPLIGTTQQPLQPPSPAPAAPSPFAQSKNLTVTNKTREALRKKLIQQSGVDARFNSQLHNAVLQNQTREEVDNLLCELSDIGNERQRLVPLINMVNIDGHTPLSLCLKKRRGDLISLLIDFDATPTQLCGKTSDRTNHFHYAFCKCLDSAAAIEMVYKFISCVHSQHQSDLLGLFAKDRYKKTPLDYLKNHIFQLSTKQQDAELLAQLQWLKNYINSILPRDLVELQN